MGSEALWSKTRRCHDGRRRDIIVNTDGLRRYDFSCLSGILIVTVRPRSMVTDNAGLHLSRHCSGSIYHVDDFEHTSFTSVQIMGVVSFIEYVLGTCTTVSLRTHMKMKVVEYYEKGKPAWSGWPVVLIQVNC